MGGDNGIGFGVTILLFFSVLGFAWWVGSVMKAEGEDKLDTACAPVAFATKELQEVTTALVGFTPNWTVFVRRWLQGGCYYFFSVVLSDNSIDSSAVTGGVRTK